MVARLVAPGGGLKVPNLSVSYVNVALTKASEAYGEKGERMRIIKEHDSGLCLELENGTFIKSLGDGRYLDDEMDEEYGVIGSICELPSLMEDCREARA